MRPLLALILMLTVLTALMPRPALAAPAVAARDWIIVDDDTGDVLASQNPHQPTAMASLTKVMTGLVAVERGDLNQRVTIVPSDLVGEASAGLRIGEDLSLQTLLYGLLMPSGNDAAMAIARAVGGSPNADDPAARERFVGWMNERAASLGLRETHFVNPHGLDAAEHVTSVYDLAVLTRTAIRNPRFLTVFTAASYSGDGHEYTRHNQLPNRYPGVVGGKTGWTDNAGLCLIEVARRDDRRLVVVLIGSTFARWYDDAADLLDYGWTIPRPATTVSGARTATTVSGARTAFSWWRSQPDGPVATGKAQRTWVWGQPLDAPHYEPYAGAPGGERLVQYFDKGRMEVNDPNASLGSSWYVTGGRLAWEMITGRRQIGDVAVEVDAPARIPLAGDPDNAGPTYATLGPLLAAPPQPAGQPAASRLDAAGRVSVDPQLAAYGVLIGPPETATHHGLASVFQGFLAQQGSMYLDGQIVTAPVFAPPFATTGEPITEPYWVRVPVGGTPRDVLVQCFERRCLTYTPSNPPEWRVEMGNIGQDYLRWLWQTQPVTSGLAQREW